MRIQHTDDRTPPRRVLAVASGGGHWIQLRRAVSELEDQDIAFLTTFASYREEVEPRRFYCVVDASRWNKFKLLWMMMQVGYVVLRERPDVVITTGAACGYFAVRFARMLGARTCWLDSIANVEQVSLSGRKAGPHCDLYLTQWPHLAEENGPIYRGGVI